TIVLRALLTDVSSFIHIGSFVIICFIMVVLGFKSLPTTLKAKSLAVNIPDKASSSSVTKTQSTRFAAISCDASITKVLSLIVKAGDGFSELTVSFGLVFIDLIELLLLFLLSVLF